ncbi:hypothetical protein [Roseicyclus mahoneyensis]|uniref:Uncharacterized protein n=1 Tax=Roseicyclus mahoneyensis TaxID=164332 RepID=A0A316GH65_9RHOB|nr:hypothetical protein [Roseicyclus mahoneyensis]PWK60396.1 hypothetical protein C7455_10432 [Roseicyclus mahoneyensis]
MSTPEHRARLMALRARRDLALRARALVSARAGAADATAMAERIAGLLTARGAGLAGGTVGALASALWLGNALQAELGKSQDRASEAQAEAQAEQTRMAAATATLRLHEDRAEHARRSAMAARETRAEIARTEQGRRS